MKKSIKFTIVFLLSIIASNTSAEQNKCTIVFSDVCIDELKEKLSSTCKLGDVLYYTTTFPRNDLSVAIDYSESLAASVCDYSKSIVMGNEGGFSCIYNGIAEDR